MSTKNEVTNSPDAATPVEASLLPADLLRSLLDDPKPKDEPWQTQAGRAVSMVAVGFLSEPNDELALRAVALLALAQSHGVKEARKRAIKLSRWAETVPPSLATLLAKDEQQAALTALAKLTTAWSRPYAEQALADSTLPEEFVPDLLKWARTTFADNLSFTRDFYAPQVVAAKSAERIAVLLKEATRLLKAAKPEVAAKPVECVSALIGAFGQPVRPAAADEKAFGSGVASLLNLIQDQAAALPAVLLQPGFVMAVGGLSTLTAKGAVSKQVAAAAEALSLATVSLLMADLERSGQQAADHWRAMLPIWRAAYSSWDASVAAAAAVSPAMAALASEGNRNAEADPDPYAAEAIFARLLPAWDAFVAELPDPSRASSLSAMLQQAAGTAGVVPLGEKGAVVGYDPLSHHLAVEADEPPRQVCVIRPGVQVLRADGSARVLVAALVTTV